MSVIVRNEYGAIAVNKGVIERMLVEDMLGLDDLLMLSDKKGRPIKERPTPFIDPDYFDAIEVSDKKGVVTVKIYIIVKNGHNISDVAGTIFDTVEKSFDVLSMDRPDAVTVKVRGIAGSQPGDDIIKRSTDIVRNNV